MPAEAFQTNCWIFAPNRNSECFIVDPGITAPSIVPALTEVFRKFNLKPIATIITHGHLDHTFSVLPFSQEYGVSTYIHKVDRPALKNPFSVLAKDGMTKQIMDSFGVTEFKEPEKIETLHGGERFSLAGFDLTAIHAPGHTAGSTMFLVNDEYLISGDVLFHSGIGRTDMPTASDSDMRKTLQHKILPLGDEVNVLPGHGQVTTIGRERKHNPYLTDSYLGGGNG